MNKKQVVLSLIAIAIFLIGARAYQVAAQTFLPIVLVDDAYKTPEPYPINTPKPTLNPYPVAPGPAYLPLILKNHPRTTEPPVARTGNVIIARIVYDFTGTSQPLEYVEIMNMDAMPINLLDWTLSDYGSRHVYTLPGYTMQPGKTCKVYTNFLDGDCNLTFGNSASVWNDGGDLATLKDYTGQVIDTFRYGTPSSAQYDTE